MGQGDQVIIVFDTIEHGGERRQHINQREQYFSTFHVQAVSSDLRIRPILTPFFSPFSTLSLNPPHTFLSALPLLHLSLPGAPSHSHMEDYLSVIHRMYFPEPKAVEAPSDVSVTNVCVCVLVCKLCVEGRG